jgi:hypothetical protein
MSAPLSALGANTFLFVYMPAKNGILANGERPMQIEEEPN